ncbi:MAG: hypothetical protein EPO08_02720 [Rhodospirillaceae bacterium]|nr:MAG: hypothetical protein EPO08_02720 [Rhodospirillaceae bacterium]
MSDDIPIIFADQILAPEGYGPRVVFFSAAATMQMQQYATAGWQVLTAPGFRATGQVDLAVVPAQAGDESCVQDADVVSLEGPLWPDDAHTLFGRWRAGVVKVNCAFQGLEDQRGEEIAATLADLGYTLLATYWQDNNSYRFSSISRLDHLAVFEPRDWKHLNIIAVRDPDRARLLVIIGRLYVGEERRIADLRLAHAIRGDQIARLEDALMARQRGA